MTDQPESDEILYIPRPPAVAADAAHQPHGAADAQSPAAAAATPAPTPANATPEPTPSVGPTETGAAVPADTDSPINPTPGPGSDEPAGLESAAAEITAGLTEQPATTTPSPTTTEPATREEPNPKAEPEPANRDASPDEGPVDAEPPPNPGDDDPAASVGGDDAQPASKSANFVSIDSEPFVGSEDATTEPGWIFWVGDRPGAPDYQSSQEQPATREEPPANSASETETDSTPDSGQEAPTASADDVLRAEFPQLRDALRNRDLTDEQRFATIVQWIEQLIASDDLLRVTRNAQVAASSLSSEFESLYRRWAESTMEIGVVRCLLAHPTPASVEALTALLRPHLIHVWDVSDANLAILDIALVTLVDYAAIKRSIVAAYIPGRTLSPSLAGKTATVLAKAQGMLRRVEATFKCLSDQSDDPAA